MAKNQEPIARFGGMRRLPITDLNELEDSHQLSMRLGQIRELVENYERTAHLRPKDSSQLGDDDRRTSYLQLTHFVSASMGMATDNLLAVSRLLQPQEGHLEHRLTAQFPLIRSAIESAATALWLVRPDHQRERILRLLRLRVSDADYDVQLAKVAARVLESMNPERLSQSQQGIRTAIRRRKKHRTQLDLIAQKVGIGVEEYGRGAPGNEEIIRQAAEDDGRAASIWRLISGLTHPSPLRMLQTSKTEQQGDNGDGTSFVISSMNVGHTTLALMCAMLLYRQATEFRRVRMLRPIGLDTR